MDTISPAVGRSRMPLWRAARPLKRWRYVGVYSPTLMLCVADVRIGPLPARFYAVAERGRPIVTAAPLRPGAIGIDGSSVRVRTSAVEIDVELDEDAGVETLHDDGRIWTRKQAGIAARGVATIQGRRHALDCRAVVDDTAGYHPRHTRWQWSAGVGTNDDGTPVAWNLVSGVNDEQTGSERAVWVNGISHEPAPVDFAEDLSGIAFADGGTLSFSEWSAREARTNLLLVRSYYRQPFGTFSGELPGAGRLAEGYGVMELHDVWW